MFGSRLAAAFAVLALAAPAAAQDMEAAGARIEASMAAAQAQARRPGDEALTCEALEGEMIAFSEDPNFRSQMGEMGETAQTMNEEAQAAQRRARAHMASNVIMGFASSFIPGLGYAQMAAQRAQMAEQQQAAQGHMANMASMMGNMEAAMPQMMRGQRVYELAQVQQCAFLEAPPPAAQ